MPKCDENCDICIEPFVCKKCNIVSGLVPKGGKCTCTLEYCRECKDDKNLDYCLKCIDGYEEFNGICKVKCDENCNCLLPNVCESC